MVAFDDFRNLSGNRVAFENLAYRERRREQTKTFADNICVHNI